MIKIPTFLRKPDWTTLVASVVLTGLMTWLLAERATAPPRISYSIESTSGLVSGDSKSTGIILTTYRVTLENVGNKTAEQVEVALVPSPSISSDAEIRILPDKSGGVGRATLRRSPDSVVFTSTFMNPGAKTTIDLSVRQKISLDVMNLTKGLRFGEEIKSSSEWLGYALIIFMVLSLIFLSYSANQLVRGGRELSKSGKILIKNSETMLNHVSELAEEVRAEIIKGEDEGPAPLGDANSASSAGEENV